MREVLVECRSSHYLWTRKARLLTGRGKSQISHDFQRQNRNRNNSQYFGEFSDFLHKTVPTPKISFNFVVPKHTFVEIYREFQYHGIAFFLRVLWDFVELLAQNFRSPQLIVLP